MIACSLRLVHERDEGGDGADDECRLVFKEGVERDPRMEAVGED